MVLSDEKIREYMRRLIMARMRILCTNGFYGLLIMHMKYALDEKCETVATDGRRISFNPEFLNKISDSELEFVLMHEILHVVLQHCSRYSEKDNRQLDMACDIVVNSNILKSCDMNEGMITIKEYGVSMHVAPDGKEGYEYTAEQVYEMNQSKDNVEENNNCSSSWDDHKEWKKTKEDEYLKDVWIKRLKDACEAVSMRDSLEERGLIPEFAIRMLTKLKKPQTDWRTVLNSFVQEEIVDYSFIPPDRRLDDCDFFLPDFNDKEDTVTDILFMIDTSGSMSDNLITVAYSEVKGAIEQFDGRLKGWLGFFDAEIVEPQSFSNEYELNIIKPCGGGGTDFTVIFKYVREYMQDRLPASIIILTDGYASFPEENDAMGIPVLWLLNNEEVNPPWGKVARIKEG